MKRQTLRSLLGAASVLAVSSASTSMAAFVPGDGYRAEAQFDTAGTFVYIEGLDIQGDSLLLGFGTNVLMLDLVTGATNAVGTLPKTGNDTIGFTEFRGTNIHASFAPFGFSAEYQYGVIGASGVYENHGVIGGLYDAAADSSDNLYFAANPGGAGTRVYRFEPSTNGLVEVINVGGFSGPIAFDSQDNLYVGEQGGAGVFRFTAAQLAAGGLTLADGTSVVAATAGQMCFDEHDRLYLTTGFGNGLEQYDVTSGTLLRTIAVDDVNGYGIGRIRWDAARDRLAVIFTDYSSGSWLYWVDFTDSNQGMEGAATPFKGWVAGYRDFIRPDINSGGYARNNTNGIASVLEAVSGPPGDFSGGTVDAAGGHVLSLGNGGSIILEFGGLIKDGPGADFAVFENAFYYGGGTFTEFAFVEVATTTNAWARFPVTCYLTNAVGLFEVLDPTRVDGVAGKHEAAYGTPFDLSWLRGDTNVLSGAVDLDRIAFVRLVDVVGDGSATDQFGRPVYDPYDAGAFPAMTDGFDLRGVGVIHLAGTGMEKQANNQLQKNWYGYSGRTYRLMKSTDFMTWTQVGSDIVGTGGVHHVSLPTGDDAAVFRVEQEVAAP